MWRPENWVNPHISLVSMKPINHEYEAYEAGADAMLEALKKGAQCCRIKPDEGSEVWGSVYIIFIPDDEKPAEPNHWHIQGEIKED